MNKPIELPGYYLTDKEAATARELLNHDWCEAVAFTDRRLKATTQLAIRVVGSLAGWSEELLRSRVRNDQPQAACLPAQRRHLKTTMIGHAVVAALTVFLWSITDGSVFREWTFPAALGAAVLWSGIRATGVNGMGLLILAIPLFIVSGVAVGATKDSSGSLDSSGAPLVLLTFVCYMLGPAQLSYGTAAKYHASAPTDVPRARLAWRLNAISLALQAFIVQLALYWLIIHAGILVEDNFNAMFRYAMFFPVAMGGVLGLQLARIANRLRTVIITAVTPMLWCAVHLIYSGQNIYSFVLEWALIDVLIVLVMLPIQGFAVAPPGRARLVGTALGLGVALALGLSAFGVVRLGLRELFDTGALAGGFDIAMWIIAPALLTALGEFVGSQRLRAVVAG